MKKTSSLECSRRQFLQGSAALGASSATVATPALADVTTDDYGARHGTLTGAPAFTNWTRNIRCHPNVLVTPTSLTELQESVAKAKSMKAVGSGHSFSPCAHADDTMIATDRLDRLLLVDRQAMRVKVEAGKKLYAFNDELAALGLALPSIGDIDRQSLAGLISTGSHGTGMKWGSFSDQASIQAIEMVLADGSLLSLNADKPEDAEPLMAVRLGLGVLGIIYSITFNVLEAHNLEAHSWLMDLEDALDPRHYLENDHFEFFRFPFTTKVKAITRNRTDKPRLEQPIRTFIDKILLENVALGAVLNAASFKPDVMPQVSRLLTHLVPDERRIDRSDKIMASTRLVRAYEMEYALPIAMAKQAHERHASVVADFSTRSDGAFFATFPSECRFLRGDQGNFLSPSQGQDTCFFSAMSHVAFKDYEPFFRAIETELLALGGRPHWGKQFYQNPTSLYPNWTKFLGYRDRWDPTHKLKNIFMDRLLSGNEMLNHIA